MADAKTNGKPTKLQCAVSIIQGTLFFLSTAFAGYVGTMFFMPLCILFQLLMPRFGRYLIDFFVGSYLMFLVGLYEHVLGVKVTFVGEIDKLRNGSHLDRLIIMNHRTRLDWLFSFSLESRFGSLLRYKIFLKRGLNHIPGAGWAMQCACFIFLHRKWALDKKWIKTLLTYFRGIDYKPHLLLYPEGTTLCTITKGWTRDYAKKNNLVLPEYDYVLYPKTTGFLFTVQQLRELRMMDQVADVTIMYPKNIVEEETDMFLQGLPREVMYHVKMFDNQDIPSDEESIKEWLLKRWELKEQFLKDFYENGKKISRGKGVDQRIPFWSQISALCFWYFQMILFVSIILMYPISLWWYASLTIACVLTSIYYSFENFYL